MAGEVPTPDIDLPDDLINSFLDPPAKDKVADKGQPKAKANTTEAETDTDLDETPDEQLESDAEADTEDEVGEEDDDDSEADDDNDDDDSEAETEEDESETDEEAEEEEESFLSKDSLKKHQAAIQKDPHLKAVYKSMQADFTRKTTDVAKHRTAYEQANKEYDEFAATLEDVADGGGREQFLVDAALDNPEAFQRAIDRAVELLESPEAKKKYERERQVDQRERRVKAQEQASAQAARETRTQEIHETAESYAKKFGIKDEKGLRVAKRYVAQVILENRTAKAHGDVFITDEQVRQAVREAALDIRDQRADAEAETGRRMRKQRLDEVKQTAKNSRKRVAPGGKRSPTSTSPRPPKKLPTGVDPLDARVDQLLSG